MAKKKTLKNAKKLAATKTLTTVTQKKWLPSNF